VARIPLQRLIPTLGMLVTGSLGAPNVLEDAEKFVLRDLLRPKSGPGAVSRLREGDEQVLAGDVFVLQQLRLRESAVEHLLQFLRRVLSRYAGSGYHRKFFQRIVERLLQAREIGAQLVQHGNGDARSVAQECAEQVDGL